MSKLLTVIVPFVAIGDRDTTMQFSPYKQYCYTGYEWLNIDGRYANFYIVTINDEIFCMDESYVMPCQKELSEEEQKSIGERAREERVKRYFVADERKQAKEVLGLDIKKNERTDYNGRWLQKLINKGD